MTKTYVPIWSKPGSKVAIETNATIGATVGTNLFRADGKTVIAESEILNSAIIQQLQTKSGTLGVTAGSYGDSTHVASFTVNALGNITLASNIAIAFPTFAALYGTPPTVTGSRGGNVALASLLTGLASKNIIIDSSTP